MHLNENLSVSTYKSTKLKIQYQHSILLSYFVNVVSLPFTEFNALNSEFNILLKFNIFIPLFININDYFPVVEYVIAHSYYCVRSVD